MLDSNPPEYTERKSRWHPRFLLSSETVDLEVEDTRFRVHKHFLSKYSPVLREIFLQHHKSSDIIDDGRTEDASTSQTSGAIRLDGVTVLELEALLTFFYESWQEGFTMTVSYWIALLSIAHRFKFTDAESRARREVFQHSPPLDPVVRILLAEKHSVPISFIIPALQDIVRRSQPLEKKELANLSREMISRLWAAREEYVRQSSRAFTSERWLLQVASNIVKSTWPNEKELA